MGVGHDVRLGALQPRCIQTPNKETRFGGMCALEEPCRGTGTSQRAPNLKEAQRGRHIEATDIR